MKRMEMLPHMSIVGGVTGVFMALLTIVAELRKVRPDFANNIERMYKFARDNDLREHTTGGTRVKPDDGVSPPGSRSFQWTVCRSRRTKRDY